MIKDNIEKKFKKGPSGLALMIILFVVVFLVGIAAGGGGGYFLSKKKNTENTEKNNTNNSNATTEEPASSDTSLPVESGEQTYTIQKGDTLFTIGLKFNIPWTKVAEANGLTESSVIKEGQIIKIPSASSTGSGESKKFTINTTSMQQVQAQVDSGQMLWYLDPVAVSKELVPTTYSITKDDKYTQKSKNTAEGIAIVEVVHSSKVYQIKLIQPVTKGENGIWAVDTVSAL